MEFHISQGSLSWYGNPFLCYGMFSSRTSLRLRQLLMPYPSASSLHLCEAAIDKQFRSGDVTAVVGCEEHHGLRDFIGCPESPERNGGGNRRHTLTARFRRSH